MSARIPSMALLRAFLPPLQPFPALGAVSSPICVRSIHNTAARVTKGWMPREKYAKVTGLDKLHRRQRAARIQERKDSQTRASSMTFAPSPPRTLEESTSSSPLSTPSESSTIATNPLFPSTPTPSPARPTTPSAPSTPLPFKLPYLITRTKSRNLPVYEEVKGGGGTKHITVIRKITGDVDALQKHVFEALKFEAESFEGKKGKKMQYVSVNRHTGHVVVRGWRGAELKRWMELGGF